MTFILAVIGLVLSVFVSFTAGLIFGMRNAVKSLKQDGWTIEPPKKSAE